MDADTIAKLGVVAIIPLLIAFGEFLKYQGVEPKYAGMCTLIIGFLVAVGYTLWKAYPNENADTVLTALVMGLLVGLGSCGFYSVTSAFGAQWFGGTRAYNTEARIQAIRMNALEHDPNDH
jgi:hypothetical protein